MRVRLARETNAHPESLGTYLSNIGTHTHYKLSGYSYVPGLDGGGESGSTEQGAGCGLGEAMAISCLPAAPGGGGGGGGA